MSLAKQLKKQLPQKDEFYMNRKDKMIGYHYTSLSCWKKIQKVGLKPYLIRKPEFRFHIGKEEVSGIWIWTQRFNGLSHIGSILYQITTKNTTQVVLLSVSYTTKNVLTDDNGGLIILHHTGHIGNLEYHTFPDDKAVVCLKAISPKKITLIKEYDLLDIWEGKKCQTTI